MLASNFAFCDYDKQNADFSRWINFEIWRFFRTNHFNLCDGNWILYRFFDELIQKDVGIDQTTPIQCVRVTVLIIAKLFIINSICFK